MQFIGLRFEGDSGLTPCRMRVYTRDMNKDMSMTIEARNRRAQAYLDAVELRSIARNGTIEAIFVALALTASAMAGITLGVQILRALGAL